ncbi:MAG TPA: fumarylacetoacetate hydrolase family protein [Bacteroidota bacterium]|nr:fumarylacetoacetate hydrolase family protein [Bacteroidota bacterium]
MKSVRFVDGESLPVGKILCLGRNYPEHAREMNAEIPSTPVVFLKPSSAIVYDGEAIVIPPISSDVHHEIELVVVIGMPARDITPAGAMGCVAGYALGLDMTLRDVQAEAKKKGLPWTVAKGFDTSAPLSSAVRAREVRDPHALTLELRVNGTVRQHAATSAMILRIPEIIAYCSTLFTLEAGDLIFTGTPEGVGRVVHGDRLEARIAGVGSLTVGVV